jgi:hypothetical protein
MRLTEHLTSVYRSSFENFSKLFFIFLLMFASTQLHAYLTINAVKINGGTNVIYNNDRPTIEVTTTVTGDGPSSSYKRWWSTAYIIDGDPSSCKYINSPDRGVAQWTIADIASNSEKDKFIESLPVGKHNVTFKASGSANACTAADASPGYTIEVERICTSALCIPFDCNTLYGATNTGQIYKFNNPSTGTARTDLYKRGGGDAETIALGPFAKEDGTLTMFNYSWAWNSGAVEYTHNNSIPISGGFTVVRPDAPAYNYWSGGEVNQITGQIFFSGGELEDLNDEDNNFRMMLAMPIKSGTITNYTRSGKIEPKTPSDKILGGNANYNGYVASDMAIDADGNAYILVGIDDEPPLGTGGGDYMWLVKVEPSTEGNWKYSRVKKISNLEGTLTYGMAFLNGKLYAATHLGNYLYEIDPLLGTYRNIGEIKDNAFDLASCQVATAITGKVYLDDDGDGVLTGSEAGVPNVTLAIYDKTGKYLGEQTTSGDGSYSFLSNDVGKANSVLYIRLKQPQINGVNTRQTWASSGNFSWTGVNGIRGTNTAEPACYNNATNRHLISNQNNSPYPNQHKYYYGITCYGARVDGVDPSSASINLGVTSDGKLNGAMFYTKVTMPTDRANVKADFAIAPVDRSDAPNLNVGNVAYKFGEAAHPITKTNHSLFLGDKVDADLNSFASDNTNNRAVNATGDDDSGVKNDDDGVQVKHSNDTNPSSFRPIQGFEFINGEVYDFRIKVQDNEGYLNAWVSFVNSATLKGNTFTNTYTNTEAGRFVTNSVVNNDGNYTNLKYDGGYLEFNYTVPNTHFENNSNNTTKAYTRFRYTSVEVKDMSFKDEPRENSYWNSHPWAIDGEVEDYMVYYHYIPRPLFVPANLTVVNENFDKTSGKTFDVMDHNTTALFTQVADKSFKAKIVAHNDGVILEKFAGNVTVIVNFVEGNSAESAECDPAYMTVLEHVGNITLQGNSTSEVVKLINNINLNHVTKNGTFMLTYYYSQYNGSYNTTTCSDPFALRPATFKLEGFPAKLIGGKVANGTIKALSNSGTVTKAYNQTMNKIAHQNSTLVPNSQDCDINLTVPNDALEVNTTNFVNGESSINIHYDNIGNINTSFVDSNWTVIDNDHPSGIYDCIPESSSNDHSTSGTYKGRLGCNIAMNSTLKFIPNDFRNTLSISDFIDSYTYLSTDKYMHAKINMSITAILYDNTTATNYHQNCFANDISYTVQLINGNLTDWDNRGGADSIARIKYFQTTGTANVTYGNEDNKTGEAILVTSQGNFTNGTANTQFGFNFERPNIEKPFTAMHSDFNVTIVQEVNGDGVNGSGVQTGKGEAHLYYGRTHSKLPEYIAYGNSANATIYYEVYCANCNKTRYVNATALDGEYPSWFINTVHVLEAGNVTKFEVNTSYVSLTANTSSNSPKSTSDFITQGYEILGVTKSSSITYTPFSVTIEMIPHSWLENDPKFKVIFEGSGGKWAGYGQSNIDGASNKTGRVIDENPSINEGIRMDW